MKKICIVGMGYVGLSLAMGLASNKHNVYCVDSNTKKIELLKNGKNYIFEDNFDNALKENVRYLKFSVNLIKSDIYFICVNTPSLVDGRCDISRIINVVDKILEIDKTAPIIIKSTCEIGTSRKIQNHIYDKDAQNTVVFNPEFLAQGTAYENTMNPDRIVIGGENKKTLNELSQILKVFSTNIVMTSWESAETIKYVSNALLATKIAAINEVANLCEKTGANIVDVSMAVGLDKRIGSSFLEAGCGFGGSCFEKDIKALLSLARQYNVNMDVFTSTLKANSIQRLKVIEKLKDHVKNLKGITVAVLGLAFKENTNDARESVGLYVVNELLKNDVNIKLYDPEAKLSFINEYEQKFGKKLEKKFFYNHIEDALDKADACIILTKWKQITQLTDNMFNKANPNMLVIDGRNCLKLLHKKTIRIGG